MEIRIGIQHVGRELVLEVAEDAAEVKKRLAAALAEEHQILELTDKKNSTVLIPVPASKIAYVECGDPDARQVGFAR